MELYSDALLHVLCSRSSQPSGVDGVMLEEEEARALEHAQGHTAGSALQSTVPSNDGSHGLLASIASPLNLSYPASLFSSISFFFALKPNTPD